MWEQMWTTKKQTLQNLTSNGASPPLPSFPLVYTFLRGVSHGTACTTTEAADKGYALVSTDKSLKCTVAITNNVPGVYIVQITQNEKLSLMRRVRITILRLVRDWNNSLLIR